MIATINNSIQGLLAMWRSRANRVPSGIKAMPHLGHFPGFDSRTVACMGHT
jgi:hypothetical protein